MEDADLSLGGVEMESGLTNGLQTDVSYDSSMGKVALEFHYKSGNVVEHRRVPR